MLKTLKLYILVTVWSSLTMLYSLLEVQFYSARKVILDDFVFRTVIRFIYI